MNLRKFSIAAITGTLVFAVTGCDYEDLNSLALPGTAGRGDHAYTVRVELENALNLVPNSPVRVGDLEVGSIRKIELVDELPVVTISLDNTVKLPENTTAKIGQTSLLGAKHIELAAPTDGTTRGTLHQGSVIPRMRTGAYPDVEQVLASVSTLLNGGGLQHIRTIVTELNRTLVGREGTARALLKETNEFLGGINAQKTQISKALDSMNVLARRFRDGNETVAGALEALPSALQVIRKERAQLVEMMEALGYFGVEAEKFVSQGGDALVRNMAALRPTLKALADSGSSLTESLRLIPGVFLPLRNISEMIRGDFINLWATVDLRQSALNKSLLGGTPLEGLLGGANGLFGQPLGLGYSAANPLTAPLTPAPLSAGAPKAGDATPNAPTPAPASPTPSPSGGGLLGGLLGMLGGN